MAAEPKSQSTYRPSTIDVISMEMGVETVCVRVGVGGGGQKLQCASWRGGYQKIT